MKHIIVISAAQAVTLKNHFFKNELEQGAFLFSDVVESPNDLHLRVKELYLIPHNSWQIQSEHYLEMKDTERARIMKMARDRQMAIIDCHSHPRSDKYVRFSLSDRHGIEEFAAYARWKLDSKPYAATVWGESSVDGVMWHGDFSKPYPIDELWIVDKNETRVLFPENSWNGKAYKGDSLWKKAAMTGKYLLSAMKGNRKFQKRA